MWILNLIIELDSFKYQNGPSEVSLQAPQKKNHKSILFLWIVLLKLAHNFITALLNYPWVRFKDFR